MQIGLEGFSTGFEFANPDTIEFEYWNEICREDVTWTKLNPDIVGLRRCTEEAEILLEELNNAS